MGKTTREYWEDAFSIPPSDIRKITSSERLELILEYFKELKEDTILDLGCGWGNKSVALVQSGFRVTATDISQNALDHLQQWAQDLGLEIDTVRTSAEGLPFLNESFGGVLVNSVLDHLNHSQGEAATKEIARVLKPDGLLFASFDAQSEDERLLYFAADLFSSLASANRLVITRTETTDQGTVILYATKE